MHGSQPAPTPPGPGPLAAAFQRPRDSRHGATGHKRHEHIDALRGFLLILIGVTHVPIPDSWQSFVSHPLGFISAAEGFFFLSGLVAGLAYTRRLRRDGWQVMTLAIYRRVLHIYLAHLLTAVSFLGWIHAKLRLTGRPPANATPPLIEQPLASFLAMAALLYQPGIIDILPTYCLFLAFLPAAIALLERGRAALFLTLSALIWLLTNLFQPQEPFIQGLINTGAFNIGAWQLLFFAGTFFGHRWAHGRPLFKTPPLWILLPITALAVYFFGIRHAIWPACVPDHWRDWLTNKNNVAPVRLLNVAIIFILTMSLLTRVRRIPLSGFFSLLGRHSLPVFTVHVLAVLFVNGLYDLFAGTTSGRLVGPALVLSCMILAAWIAERRVNRRAQGQSRPPAAGTS